jgi:hypothetical protein
MEVVINRLMQHKGFMTVPKDAEEAVRRMVSSAFDTVTAECDDAPKNFVKVLAHTQTGICRKLNAALKKWRKVKSGVSPDNATERVEEIVEKHLIKMHVRLWRHTITPLNVQLELDLLEDNLNDGLGELFGKWKP